MGAYKTTPSKQIHLLQKNRFGGGRDRLIITSDEMKNCAYAFQIIFRKIRRIGKKKNSIYNKQGNLEIINGMR